MKVFVECIYWCMTLLCGHKCLCDLVLHGLYYLQWLEFVFPGCGHQHLVQSILFISLNVELFLFFVFDLLFHCLCSFVIMYVYLQCIDLPWLEFLFDYFWWLQKLNHFIYAVCCSSLNCRLPQMILFISHNRLELCLKFLFWQIEPEIVYVNWNYSFIHPSSWTLIIIWETKIW